MVVALSVFFSRIVGDNCLFQQQLLQMYNDAKKMAKFNWKILFIVVLINKILIILKTFKLNKSLFLFIYTEYVTFTISNSFARLFNVLLLISPFFLMWSVCLVPWSEAHFPANFEHCHLWKNFNQSWTLRKQFYEMTYHDDRI